MRTEKLYYVVKGKFNNRGTGNADRCSELFTDIEQARNEFTNIIEDERADIKSWNLYPNEHIEIWLQVEARVYEDDEDYDIENIEDLDCEYIYDNGEEE